MALFDSFKFHMTMNNRSFISSMKKSTKEVNNFNKTLKTTEKLSKSSLKVLSNLSKISSNLTSNFKKVSRETNKISTQMNMISKRTDLVSKSVLGVSKNMRTYKNTLTQVSRQLAQFSKGIKTSITGLNTNLRRMTKETVSSIKRVSKLNKSFQKGTTVSNGYSKALLKVTTSVRNYTSNLSTTATKTLQVNSQMLNGINKMNNNLNRLGIRLRSVTANQNKMGLSLRSTASRAKSYSTQMTAATSRTKRFRESVQRLSSHSNILTSSIQRVISIVRTAFYFGIAYKYVKSLTDAFIEQDTALGRLSKLMAIVPGTTREATQAMADYATELSKTRTVARDVYQIGASQLATFYLQADSIRQLLPSYADLLAGIYGVEVSQKEAIHGANILGKAFMGLPGMMRRWGITLSDAQSTLIKTGDEAQRTATLIDVITQNFGGMAEALADTYAGKIEQMKVEFRETGKVLGAYFMPLVMRGTKALREFAINMADLFEDPSTVLDKIQDKLKTLFNSLSPVAKAVVTFIGTFMGLNLVIKSFDVLYRFIINMGKLFNKFALTIYGVVAAAIMLRTAWNFNWFGIADAFGELSTNLKSIWQNENLTNIQKIGESISELGKGAAQTIKNIGIAINSHFGGNTTQYVSTLETAFTGLSEAWSNIFSQDEDKMKKGIASLGQGLLELPAKIVFSGFGDSWEDTSLTRKFQTLATNSAIFTAFSGGNLRIGLGLSLITDSLFGSEGSDNPAESAAIKAIEAATGAMFISRGNWKLSIAIGLTMALSEMVGVTQGNVNDLINKLKLQDGNYSVAMTGLATFDMEDASFLEKRIAEQFTKQEKAIEKGQANMRRDLSLMSIDELLGLSTDSSFIGKLQFFFKQIELIAVDFFLDVRDTFVGIWNSTFGWLVDTYQAVIKNLDPRNWFKDNPNYNSGSVPVYESNTGGGTGSNKFQPDMWAKGNTAYLDRKGIIQGVGTSTSDSNLAWLSNGEAVINAESTKKYGELLKAINENKLPGYATGRINSDASTSAGSTVSNPSLTAQLNLPSSFTELMNQVNETMVEMIDVVKSTSGALSDWLGLPDLSEEISTLLDSIDTIGSQYQQYSNIIDESFNDLNLEKSRKDLESFRREAVEAAGAMKAITDVSKAIEKGFGEDFSQTLVDKIAEIQFEETKFTVSGKGTGNMELTGRAFSQAEQAANNLLLTTNDIYKQFSSMDMQQQLDKELSGLKDLSDLKEFKNTKNLLPNINSSIDTAVDNINVLAYATAKTSQDIEGLSIDPLEKVQEDFIGNLKDIATPISDTISGVVGDAFTGITKATENVSQGMQDKGSSLKDNGFNLLGGAVSGLGKTLGMAVPLLQMFGSGLLKLLSPVNMATEIFGGIMSVLMPLLDSVLKPIFSLLKTFGQFIAVLLLPVFGLLKLALTPLIFAVNAVSWAFDQVILWANNLPIVGGFLTSEQVSEKNKSIEDRMGEYLNGGSSDGSTDVEGDQFSAGGTRMTTNNITIVFKENIMLTNDKAALKKLSDMFIEYIRTHVDKDFAMGGT